MNMNLLYKKPVFLQRCLIKQINTTSIIGSEQLCKYFHADQYFKKHRLKNIDEYFIVYVGEITEEQYKKDKLNVPVYIERKS